MKKKRKKSGRTNSRRPGLIIKRKRNTISDSRLQNGLVTLRASGDLGSAAKAARISQSKFKREALKRKLIKKRGKSWIVSRDLHRQMLIYSEAKQAPIKLRTGSARLAGKYMSAVGAFLRSNNIRILDEFIDRDVKDISGKRHVFETNPNTLYRLTSSTDEAFEHIYRIVLD